MRQGPGVLRAEPDGLAVVGNGAVVVLPVEGGTAAIAQRLDTLCGRLACIVDDAATGRAFDIGTVGAGGARFPVGRRRGLRRHRNQQSRPNEQSTRPARCHVVASSPDTPTRQCGRDEFSRNGGHSQSVNRTKGEGAASIARAGSSAGVAFKARIRICPPGFCWIWRYGPLLRRTRATVPARNFGPKAYRHRIDPVWP
jgi:hypothetical protein